MVPTQDWSNISTSAKLRRLMGRRRRLEYHAQRRRKMPAFRRTKIVITLGPATDRGETLRHLLEAGADVARLNFSHDDRDSHAARIAERPATGPRDRDASSPSCRTCRARASGPAPSSTGTPSSLHEGASLVLTTQPVAGTAERVSTNFARCRRLWPPATASSSTTASSSCASSAWPATRCTARSSTAAGWPSTRGSTCRRPASPSPA